MTQRNGTYHIKPQRIIEVGGTTVVGRPAAKPALARKPTTQGMSPASDDRSVEQRSHAIDGLLASYRGRKTFLQPRSVDVEQRVTAAMATIGRKFSRTSIISIEAFRRNFNELPFAVRGEAYAGLRQGIENGLAMPAAALLCIGTGFDLKHDRVFQPSAVKDLVSRASAWLSETAGDVLPQVVIDGFAEVLGIRLRALANGSPDLIRKVEPFGEMWDRGYAPVGLLTDQSFLVIVK